MDRGRPTQLLRIIYIIKYATMILISYYVLLYDMMMIRVHTVSVYIYLYLNENSSPCLFYIIFYYRGTTAAALKPCKCSAVDI